MDHVETPAALLKSSRGGRLRQAIPRGGSLPVEEWRRRHRWITTLLWLNVAVFPPFAIALGHTGVVRSFDDAAAVAVMAILGSWRGASSKLRSIAVSLGLLTAAALFVDAAGGRIEAHFYFFVLILVLTLYEDWTTFLVAVAFVLIHHGVIGTLSPRTVFDRPEEWAHPWEWAGIHAAFVAAAGIAAIATWRLNEDIRSKMRLAHVQLQELSETDHLTGLGNRRKLMNDLEALIAEARPVVLVQLDLDGFKAYNDSFGHPTGDALLVRLAGRLADAAEEGSAYRLGGDEFCALWRADAGRCARLEAHAAAAMCEQGDGFSISTSYGSVAIPDEAASVEAALRTADHRMYARKHSSRSSPRTQTRDVLLSALAERHPELGVHVDAVTVLAADVARRVGLAEAEVEQVRHAAQLHDIGKVAIPDALINKPGPLDEQEWAFIRQHTVIGERILRSAPALRHVASLVRASHERLDGSGYPDGLIGDQIPLGARIIAVCDAFDAMTSDRPYRLAQSQDAALAELKRCAGMQFDPAVVASFEAALKDPRPVGSPSRAELVGGAS